MRFPIILLGIPLLLAGMITTFYAAGRLSIGIGDFPLLTKYCIEERGWRLDRITAAGHEVYVNGSFVSAGKFAFTHCTDSDFGRCAIGVPMISITFPCVVVAVVGGGYASHYAYQEHAKATSQALQKLDAAEVEY